MPQGASLNSPGAGARTQIGPGVVVRAGAIIHTRVLAVIRDQAERVSRG